METGKQTPAVRHTTHAVFNQPPPLVDYTVFIQDAALLNVMPSARMIALFTSSSIICSQGLDGLGFLLWS